MRERNEEVLRRVAVKAEESGSAQWANRSSLEEERRLIQDTAREHEDALLLLAAGPEPLKLLKPLIQQAIDRAELDNQILLEKKLVTILKNRDAALSKHLDKAAADKANVFLEQDLNERNQIASKNTAK